jgi:hypothetical protein
MRTTMAALYKVFGLTVRTSSPLPGQLEAADEGAPDVDVWLRSRPAWLAETLPPGAAAEPWRTGPHRDAAGRPLLAIYRHDGGRFYHFQYHDGLEFLIDGQGARVWADWPDTMPAEEVALCLFGPVAGFLLRLRGRTCLHASVVEIGGGALLVVGPAGSGKSTTAAALVQRGLPLVADDIALLREEGGQFLVEPTSPQLRLWPDVVTALFGKPEILPRLVPNWDKRALTLGDRSHLFRTSPLPVAAVYLLGRREMGLVVPRIEPMHNPTGLIDLVANTYLAYASDGAMLARDLAVLTRLVAQVSLCRLTAQTEPATLDRLASTLAADALSRARHARSSCQEG